MLSILLLLQLVSPVFAHPPYDVWSNADAVPVERSLTSGPYCCSRLKSLFGDKVSFPGSASFIDQQNGTDGYWAAQAASVIPACRFTPTCVQDVSAVVAELSHLQCKFAVRGGGHMWWAGASNIQDGVTIDLSAINEVKVSKDHKITSVGGGARWEDVYIKLDAMNLSVVGGRVFNVGVGGLILGGGNSFFAPRFGFACDNVENYEIVLASGQVVNASAFNHGGLYKALKGGGNNFGIVTRFDLKTFEQGKIWGGEILHPYTDVTEQLQALENFGTASGAGEDPFASVETTFAFTGSGPAVILNQIVYTKAQAYPEITKNFTDIQSVLINTMRITNLTNITIEYGTGIANGGRYLFGTATFDNNATLLAQILSIVETTFKPVQRNYSIGVTLQAVPKSITSKAALNGGNSLGLGPEDGNMIWMDFTVIWSNAGDDTALNAATETFLSQAVQFTKAQGQYNGFLYSNYALPSQDPIASYGPVNQATLRAVSKVYDPNQVFQRLVPGGFKLYRKGPICC